MELFDARGHWQRRLRNHLLAGRHWLHPAQEAAILDRVQEYCSRNVREGALLNTYEDGTEKWEQTWMPDDWLLPNCRWFLVHYEYSSEQGTFNYKVWGMVPA